MPGININEEEIWLSIDRLHESYPPIVNDALLKLWIDVSNHPSTKPTLKKSLELKELIAAGLIEKDKNNHENQDIMLLQHFIHKNEVEKQLNNYISSSWLIWSNEEKNAVTLLDYIMSYLHKSNN